MHALICMPCTHICETIDRAKAVSERAVKARSAVHCYGEQREGSISSALVAVNSAYVFLPFFLAALRPARLRSSGKQGEPAERACWAGAGAGAWLKMVQAEPSAMLATRCASQAPLIVGLASWTAAPPDVAHHLHARMHTPSGLSSA